MKRLLYFFLYFFGNPEYLKLGGMSRSPHWPTVRKNFLKSHPACEVCAGEEDLDVHHCVPFHFKPVLELDESNLITLCTPHHFLVGHLMSWKSFNEDVRKDASTWRQKILNRPKVDTII